MAYFEMHALLKQRQRAKRPSGVSPKAAGCAKMAENRY